MVMLLLLLYYYYCNTTKHLKNYWGLIEQAQK